MKGRAHLRRLTRALERGRPIPADVAQWLAEGFEQFEQGTDLAAALRLKTTAELKATRNHHLHEAAKAMPATWKNRRRALEALRAACLVADVESESDGLQFLREWERQIWHAQQAAPLPGRRQLRRLLAIESRMARTGQSKASNE